VAFKQRIKQGRCFFLCVTPKRVGAAFFGTISVSGREQPQKTSFSNWALNPERAFFCGNKKREHFVKSSLFPFLVTRMQRLISRNMWNLSEYEKYTKVFRLFTQFVRVFIGI
jgi:hypothetical protein